MLHPRYSSTSKGSNKGRRFVKFKNLIVGTIAFTALCATAFVGGAIVAWNVKLSQEKLGVPTWIEKFEKLPLFFGIDETKGKQYLIKLRNDNIITKY